MFFYRISYSVLFIILLLVTTSPSVIAQNHRKLRADKFFESGEYAKAATIYKRALKRTKLKPEKAEINFKIAECLRIINSLRKIEGFYKKAIQMNYPDAIVHYNYATVLQKMEKFDEAIVQYNKYTEKAPTETKGKDGVASVKFYQESKKNPTTHQISVFKKINSKFNDFCPAADGLKDFNDIYFSSDRDKNASKHKKTNTITGPMKSNITGNSFCELFLIKKNKKEEWTDPVALDTTINTIFDDGAPSLTSDSKFMYYTTCKIEKGKQIGCQIFEVKKTAGEWGVPNPLKLFKDSSISIGHPSISPDGNTLYFASSMRGSIGGMDIWKVEKKGSDWGTAQNLKEINTEYNEDFPYVHEKGVIYFSSDRQPSFGGLDIFKAEADTAGKYTIENLGYPMNSPGDDFGIVFQGKSNKGLFTSNRNGGQGGDDIYRFEVPPVEFHLKGLVKSNEKHTIPGAIVKLFGSDGSSFRDTSDKEGVFRRKLKKNTDYVFAVYKDSYFMGKGKFSTVGLTKTTEIVKEVTLTALARTFEIPNINYDFGSWTLKPESKLALDSLVEILKDNPNLTIELSSHSDMVGTEEINLEISQKRVQSVVDYVIERGINADRMVGVGYGKSKPKIVTKEMAAIHSFMKEGDILNDAFVNKLPEDQKTTANTYNRRTEFKVLSTNYVPGKK